MPETPWLQGYIMTYVVQGAVAFLVWDLALAGVAAVVAGLRRDVE